MDDSVAGAVLHACSSTTGFGLTVLAGGAVISGLVATPKEYLEALTARAVMSDSESGRVYGNILADSLPGILANAEANEDQDTPIEPTWLYFTDALVFVGGVPLGSDPIDWCCRIDSVDAFTVGSIKPG